MKISREIACWVVSFAAALPLAAQEEGGAGAPAPAVEQPAAPAGPAATPTPAASEIAPAVAAPEAAAPAAEPPVMRVVVFLPEQIDAVWFWYYYTDQRQHLVQTAVEQALLRNGVEIVDLGMAGGFDAPGSLAEVTDTRGALQKAAALGATHAIIGQASATMASQGVAYNVNVFRSQAEITARLVRVRDARVLAVESASGPGSGQAQRTAGQAALKEAGQQIARKLAAAIRIAAAAP